MTFQPGYKHSPEVLERIKAAVNARWSDPEYREKQRQKHTGFKHTEESKKKMSAAKIGIKKSAETRAKMSKAQKGKTVSREICIKLSYAQRNRSKIKPVTDETREKQSLARKAYVERIKAEKGQLENV